MAIKRPRLKLTKGKTYTFDVSDSDLSNHPFKFTADSGTSEYTTGVTLTGTQGQAGASISFNISDSAPSNMNYYCGTHGLGMGNHIVIADAPASGGGGGGTSLNVNNLDTYPTAFKPISYFGLILKFKGDGTAFTWWYQTQNMEWWDLSTPWDLSTATKNNTKSQTPNNILDANGFVYFDYNSDGTKLLSYSYDNPEPKVGLKEWSLSTAYDPNSHGVSPSTNSSITSATFNAGNPKTYSNYNQIQWIDSGNKVALTEGSTEGVNFYNATTAYDLTTIDFTSPSSTHTSVGYPNYISAKNWWFSDDGLSAYTASPHANSSVRVTQCSMSSPWDLSTLTVVAEKELGTFNNGPNVMTHVDDIHVEPSQGKLYLTAYGGVDSDGNEWNDGTGTYQNTKAWIGEWQFNSKNPFDLSTSFFINAIKAYGADSDVNTYSSNSTQLSGDFNDPEAMATNGKYTLLSDANIMINHSGPGSTGNSIIAGSGGWTWLVRNSDGALMKSWNGLISDYDHNLLDLETYYIGAGGGTPYYSKYHTCNWGKQVGMNDNYMFIGCGYRPTGGSNTSLNWSDGRAFIFVYDIEPPHALRKVWKLEDFVSSLPNSGTGYTGGGTGFMEQNFTLTNNELFVPVPYVYYGATSTEGGKILFWDISDANPNNWSSSPDTTISTPLNPVSNPVYMNWNNTGVNYSNKNFGQGGVAYGHNRMVTGHGVYMHTYTRSGNTFTHNSDVVVGPYRTYSYEPYASFTNDAANPRLLSFGYGTAGSNTTREIRLLDPANNLSADWTVDLNAPSTSGYPWGARPLTVGKDVKVELFSYGDGYKNNKAGHVRFLKLSDQSQVLDLDNPKHRDSDGLYFGDNYAIGHIDSAGSNKYSLVSWGEPDDDDTKDIISFNILQWDSDTGSLFLQGNPPASASATGFINQTNTWTVAGGTGTVNQTNTSNLGNGITQAADKSYYITGEVHSKSGWLAKFNESGVFQWAREYGTYYLRSEDVITDNANNVYVVGSDYGYGKNFQAAGGTYDPQNLYIAKFNDAGTRQWSKVLRYNSITDNAASTYSNHVEIDSHGNLWMVGSVNWTATGLNSQTIVLYKVDSSGALGGVWYLPSSVAANNSPLGLMIDNDNIYITFTQYVGGGSYPHGVVAKLSIPGATGSPTYTWVKEYGITSNAAYYDVPYGTMKSSDGNLIVYGYSDNGGAGSGSSSYYTSIMKLNDTNGDFIWKKLYDQTYGNAPINATIDANDNIYITNDTNNAGYTHYYFWMRQIDASDGSTKKVYELDFTGTANNGSVWRFETESGRGLQINRDGNVMMLMSPNGNAAGSYEQALIKFPGTISAGTFGKLVITETTPTTTDITYNAIDQTAVSYSTVTSIGGQFQMDNYNAGTYNDTVYTPTLTEDLDTIT